MCPYRLPRIAIHGKTLKVSVMHTQLFSRPSKKIGCRAIVNIAICARTKLVKINSFNVAHNHTTGAANRSVYPQNRVIPAEQAEELKKIHSMNPKPFLFREYVRGIC